MIKPHSFLIETRNTSWVFEIGATATPLKSPCDQRERADNRATATQHKPRARPGRAGERTSNASVRAE